MSAPTEPRTAAVVLAAGLGTRFGSETKQLAEVKGLPLVAHVVRVALAAAVDSVVVVVGHDADRVRQAVPHDARVRSVTNPDPSAGLASSLRCGVTAVEDEVDALVVLLGDQPGVSPAAVRAVVHALPGHQAARVRYRDRPGHPVAFARGAFGELGRLEGDVGARDLLDRLDTAEVVFDEPSPADIDTPADLGR